MSISYTVSADHVTATSLDRFIAMRRATLLGIALALLSACTTTATTVSQATASPTSATAHATGGRVAGQPSSTPSSLPGRAWFAVETSHTALGSIKYGQSSGCFDRLAACAPPDTVEIIGVDGRPLVSYSFTPITAPWTCSQPALGPQAYVVGDRVFFIDGRGVVRSLAADGTTETVASFPIGVQQEISFAVRPDQGEVLAAIVTLPQPPAADCAYPFHFGPGSWVMDLYRSDIGGSSQPISHQEVPQDQIFDALQLVGWTAMGPIATHPTQITGVGATHLPRWFGPIAGVDPTTGAITPHIPPFLSDFSADGSYVTADPDAITVFAPNGSKEWSYLKAWRADRGCDSALLAPDSQHAVVCGRTFNQPEIVGREGTDVTVGTPSERFEALGWLDQSTIIGWLRGVEELGLVRTNLPMQITDLDFAGTYVGVLGPPA